MARAMPDHGHVQGHASHGHMARAMPMHGHGHVQSHASHGQGHASHDHGQGQASHGHGLGHCHGIAMARAMPAMTTAMASQGLHRTCNNMAQYFTTVLKIDVQCGTILHIRLIFFENFFEKNELVLKTVEKKIENRCTILYNIVQYCTSLTRVN